MKDTLNQIKKSLENYNKEVQQNMKFMLNRYSKKNWKNLPENEKKTNRIDIYRSIDSNNCGFTCSQVESESESFIQIEDGLSYDEIIIFDKWDTIWDLDKTDEKIEKYGEIFHAELEAVYLSWVANNFYIAKEGKETNLQICLTENNSQRSFDLNLLNWDSFIDIYNYRKYKFPYFKKIPSSSSLRKRILMGFLGDEVNYLQRTLSKGNHQVEFIFDDWSIKTHDNIKGITFKSSFKTTPISMYFELK